MLLRQDGPLVASSPPRNLIRFGNFTSFSGCASDSGLSCVRAVSEAPDSAFSSTQPAVQLRARWFAPCRNGRGANRNRPASPPTPPRSCQSSAPAARLHTKPVHKTGTKPAQNRGHTKPAHKTGVRHTKQNRGHIYTFLQSVPITKPHKTGHTQNRGHIHKIGVRVTYTKSGSYRVTYTKSGSYLYISTIRSNVKKYRCGPGFVTPPCLNNPSTLHPPTRPHS